MKSQSKQSFIMVFALFVFTLLTVLVYALASVARTEVIKAKTFIKRDRAYYLMLRGVSDAKARLIEELASEAEEENNDEDMPVNLSQNWAQKLEQEIEYIYPAAEARLTVEITDESGYIDLITFKDELQVLFDKSFEKIEYAPKGDDYLSLITDYEDEDDDEQDLGSEDKAKNSPIVVLDELNLIFGFNYMQLKHLKEYWSLRPNGSKLNINTASNETIKFLSEAFAEKYLFAEKAFSDILNYRSSDASELANYYAEESWSQLVGENPNLKTLFEKCFTIDSSRFRIKSTAQIGEYTQSLTAVFDLEDKRFVYWRYDS